jgi:hypothetical protein
VGGAAGEEVECVGEEGQDGAKGTLGSCGAAGEVDDEGGVDGAADGAAEGGEGRLGEAGGAHELGESFDEAVADEAGGLGGDVALGESGASGGDDELGGLGADVEGVDDVVELVGKDAGLDFGDSGLVEEAGDGRAGEVVLLAAVAAVADGEDDGAGVGGETGSHVSSLLRGGKKLYRRGVEK